MPRRLATFNPTVVRLGRGRGLCYEGRHAALSIPLWCDWDICRGLTCSHSRFFQSHCGAIGTRQLSSSLAAGGRASLNVTVGSKLSIPLWCDWDFIARLSVVPPFTLSIPLWCDWDMWDIVKEPILPDLSIPLWCDWDSALST